MAKNLQSKLPPSDVVRIFDINKDAMQKLAGEMKGSQAGGAAVETAASVAEAAKDAVGSSPQCPTNGGRTQG
jgi:3-hydroxyisobutyrate/3-hydroxypropionate dehydrogenase